MSQSASEAVARLQNASGWRKKELQTLQSAIPVIGKSSRFNLMRGSLVLLCAHCEGFLRDATTVYLRYLEDRSPDLDAVRESYIILLRPDGLTKPWRNARDRTDIEPADRVGLGQSLRSPPRREPLQGLDLDARHEQIVFIEGQAGPPQAQQHRDQHGRMLLADPELIEQATRRLLDKHFPPSWHDAIRDAVGLARPVEQGLQPEATNVRDPGFRHAVLRAYERRCVVCGFDVRLDDHLVGLEAAHIKWHSHGGPDEVRNGLALCILHHRTFDRGAIGLERSARGLRLVVSDEVNGQSPAFRQLLDCHGKPIRKPQRARQTPNPDFVDWHRREVFRGSPREIERCR